MPTEAELDGALMALRDEVTRLTLAAGRMADAYPAAVDDSSQEALTEGAVRWEALRGVLADQRDKWGPLFTAASLGGTPNGEVAERPEDEAHDELARVRQERDRAMVRLEVNASLVGEILRRCCETRGLSLESSADPGKPARNYELALRLGIEDVFGMHSSSGYSGPVGGQEGHRG